MRIVCLPIDSRPCNTQFVESLTQWGGGACVLPAPAEMDDFRRPAAFADSRAFLERELPQADAAVINLEHWCFGGLLASREYEVDEAEALNRVRALGALLRAYPDKPAYLSTIILRSSLSTLREEDVAVYRAMTAYSVHTARFARLGLPEDAAAVREAAGRIPPELLARTRAVRKRNLAVNLAAVELAAEGLTASLSVLQEDTQTEGLPRWDQETILAKMRVANVRNVFLRNGADEAGALGAAQALRRGRPALPVTFRWLGRADFVAPYEDRPFRENLESACAELGIQMAEDAETVVMVCCPEAGEQAESDVPVSEGHLRAIAQAVDAQIAAGRRVYLLDVMRANGGVFQLMGMLAEPDRLWGYSAWNTASNAMGTLLAQLATDHLRGAPNRRFLAERLLDDWLYQGRLRGVLTARLERAGEDIYCLKDKGRAEEALRALYEAELPARWPLKTLPACRVSLPWPRLFEIRAEAGNV
ncbi:MAG: DUF4127 family protein [Clostridia bacterium]|nr:DUF4127 family protein [Clostridia bacterium]